MIELIETQGPETLEAFIQKLVELRRIAAIVLYQTYAMEMGELFGYLLYVIVVAGIVAVIWLLIKPTK